MTVRLARASGRPGRVFANDIQPQMLEILRRRLAQRERSRTSRWCQGTIDDPKLPPASVDLELMVDVYHELSQPQAMLRHLREALEAGRPARAARVPQGRSDDSDQLEHKMSVAEAKMEVEAEGFTLAKVDEALPRQHILIFTPSC